MLGIRTIHFLPALPGGIFIPYPKFLVGDRVMVFMPSETVGKNRKLARPYHGPYRVVHITPSNAEVRLIEHPTEPSIFVAIERLRKCYPEQTNDCWLGTKKRIPKKRNAKQFTPGSTVGNLQDVAQLLDL